MRILHVHTRYRERGGEDTVVEAERSLLSGADFEVAALDFRNPSSALGSMAALARSPWNGSAAGQVVEAAQRHDADLVHLHNTWFALSPAAVVELRRAGFPVVMTFHNYRLVCVNASLLRDGLPCEVCVGGSTLPGVRYRCYRGSYAQSTMASATIELHRRRRTWAEDLSVAITLTEFAKKRLLQGGLPPDRTVVKPNFVADPGPRPHPPSHSHQVLFVGRLSPEKGVQRLLEAWAEENPQDLELFVIGSGPIGADLAASAPPGVRVLGQLSPGAVMSLMLDSRALILPSLLYEVQPMVALEALAAGLPVLHTDLGALGDTCGAGGLSLGLGTVRELISGLRTLSAGDLLDGLGKAARREFEMRFTGQQSLDTLRGIYDLALGRDNPVSP